MIPTTVQGRLDLYPYLKEFFKQPNTVIIEAPNGIGKTTASSRLVKTLQKWYSFERIYFVGNTHKTCENIVNKLLHYNVENVIWYEGINRSCIEPERIKKVVELGLPPGFACLLCPHRLKIKDYRTVIPKSFTLIKSSEFRHYDFTKGRELCGHVIIRKYALDPSITPIQDKPPVFVVPFHILTERSLFLRYIEHAKRARKVKKWLFIIDEADSILYNGIETVIHPPAFTAFDEELLASIDALAYVDIYSELYDTLKGAVMSNDKTLYELLEDVKRFFQDEYIRKIVKRVYSKRRKLMAEAFSQNEYTFIPTALKFLNPFLLGVHGFPELDEKAAMTLELVNYKNGQLVYTNYTYATKILFSVTYPVKYAWKIVLSATFPRNAILYISSDPETIAQVFKARVVLSYPKNTYITGITLYNPLEVDAPPSRVYLFSQPKTLGEFFKQLDEELSKFEEVTKYKVKKGMVFLGSKKQMRAFLGTLKRVLMYNPAYRKIFKIVEEKNEYCILQFYSIKLKRRLQLFITYLGGRYARSIDLPDYDFSVALAPFLRPLRRWVKYLPIDRARAIAEAIQAVMRIVRTPNPKTPKLIIFETSLCYREYVLYMPEWFKEFVKHAKLKDAYERLKNPTSIQVPLAQ